MTSTTSRSPLAAEPEPSRARLYLLAVLVEALVILALWAFSRSFGS